MNSADQHRELIGLLEAYVCGRISETEWRRLQELLKDDQSARQTYFDYLDLHLGLRHVLNVEPAALPPASVEAGWNARISTWRKRRLSWGRSLLAFGVAAVFVVLFLLVVRSPDPARTTEPAPTITRVLGNVRIVNADGQSRQAALGMEVFPGERIETQSPESLAELTYADGTKLTLLNEASLTRENARAKKLLVHRGVVSAEVTAQPADAPMQLSTPGARVEVVGTRFALAASPDYTELNVAEGRVRVTRVSDGQSVEVVQGQSIVTNGEIKLAVRRRQGPRAEWEADFEQGVAKGWTGSFIAEDLPQGSLGAIGPVRDADSDPIVYSLASRDEWVDGLFQIHDDTHLHITLKMERPNWLNVFFTSRGEDPTKPAWALHIFNEVPFWKQKPGEWRTITIPLKEFRRKRDGVFHQEPPKVGEVVYELSVSFIEEDRGLVVDRIWATRDGPGIVETRPVR